MPARYLTRALWATRTQFAALGLLSGIWGVHIPSVKQQYALGEARLSLVLLSVALGAVLMLLGTGRLIARLGVRASAWLAVLAMSAMLALSLHWTSLPALLPSMLLFGAAMSLFDVAINTEGSTLEALGGRAVMGNLHGCFSLGGMAGAALGALLLRLQWPVTLKLATVGLLIGAAGSLAARAMVASNTKQTVDEEDAAPFSWPRGPLLVLGLLIFAAMSAEGAMYDWSVLYLEQELELPQDRAALGYAVFAAAMALARLLGDRLRERHAERWLLRLGGGMTALAMEVVLLTSDPLLALLGYGITGAGLALSAPILYNAATRVPGTTRAAAITSVNTVGYSGFLLGPPLIGALAQGFGLSRALCVVVLGSSLLAWGARFVPQPAAS
jgi:fucose permease